MENENTTPAGQGPLDGDNFDRTWEAAQRGEFAAAASAQQSAAPPDASAQAAPEGATSPAPAAAPEGVTPAPGQGQAPDTQAWTPPTREEWEQAQQAARHWASFQGNFPKIEERWKQENLAPLQQQLEQIQQERDRIRNERETILNTYLGSLPPAQQAQMRQRVNDYYQEQDNELNRQRQEAQREAQIAQREQAIQQSEQRIFEQEATNLRMTVKSSIDPYVDTLSTTFDVPKAEIRAYIDSLKLGEMIDQAPVNELAMVGPMMRAVEVYAQQRGTQIAAENARRRTDAGTYRTEGTGAGAGGARVSVADMPDKDFENLWNAVKAGGTR